MFYGGRGHRQEVDNVGSYVWPVRAGQCGGLMIRSFACQRLGRPQAIMTGMTERCKRALPGQVLALHDHGDGTVTDTLTGLMWTKNANPAGNYMPWQQALDYVKTLNTGGYTDWRLPNKKELRSLCDYSQYNPRPAAWASVHQCAVRYSYYWSSTTIAYVTYGAWGFFNYNGSVSDVVIKSSNGGYGSYVWPVRSGGSFGPYGH